MGKGNDTQTREETKKAEEQARETEDLAIMSEVTREREREDGMTTLAASKISEEEQNNLILRSQREVRNRLSEEEKQKLRNRDEETLRKVKVQLNAEMKKELQDFTRNAALESRNKDERVIRELIQDRERIAAEEKQRRDQLARDLERNLAKEKEIDEMLKKANAPREPARQPQKSTQACCSLF